MLAFADQKGPFGPFVKQLLSAAMQQEQGLPDPHLTYLLGQLVSLCCETLEVIAKRRAAVLVPGGMTEQKEERTGVLPAPP